MKNLRSWLVAALACTGACPAQALEWKETWISVTAERGAEVVRTKFDFKNTGKTAVHLLGVTTSCSCTEATVAGSSVASGEAASLQVLFTVGRRWGLQEEEIDVMTDESNVATKLRLKVTIPPPRRHDS